VAVVRAALAALYPLPGNPDTFVRVQRGDVIAERFEIEHLAGSGGMGEVYRARDRVTGEAVALKCLLGGQRSRFDLEARVLSRFEHPAVVRYVAHGETPRGEAWLAMEWLDGEPLSARLARGPLTVAETLGFGLAVADALGAAHARGLVHRDIKPENVFLVGGDPARVKLVDFGVVRVGRLPRETRAGMVLGTLGYMAPEQARGTASIDARADVFSLGCVLFECLAGAPLFVGDDALALLAKVVIEEVPRAGERRADVPPALDDLLARMLQKDAALRPRDGAAVAAELAAIAAPGEGTRPSRVPGPELTQGERWAPTLLGRATPCVGRERELGTLDALFEAAAGEPGAHVALLTAPAGFGKSRLARELTARLDGRAEIWIGRGDPSSAGSAFSVLAGALRHAAGLFDGDPLPLRHEKLRARVARHVAADDRARVAAFLGEIVGAPFPDDATPELPAARRDAVLMGDQMRRAWVDFARAACAWSNVVLVLDDLHWGDLPTLQLVDAALEALRARPFLVLGLGRPEVHEHFPRLWAEHDVTELRLGGLPPDASAELVRAVLGGVAPATAARLVEQADGHPLYLEELIRAAAHGAGDALPETVLAMVETRLERLAPEARRALRAASVFGEVFWAGGLAALLGDADEAALRLDELLAEELVVRSAGARFAGEDELSLRHALVREAAYGMLTEKDRRLGHQLAGEWLERAGETDAMVLAAHFEGGEDPGRAVGWFRRAAEQALEGNDLDAVLERAARGVACGATGEALGALELFRAQALSWRGDEAGAETHGRAALAHLAPRGALWFAAARQVILAADGERLREVVQQVRAAPRDDGIAAAQLGALSAGYGRLLAAGRAAEAAELLPAIEALAERGAARDPAAAAAIQDARAYRAFVAGDAAEFLRAAESARASFERAGDLRSAAARQVQIGRAWALVGAYDEAERALRAAVDETSRLGLLPLMASSRRWLGLTLARLGQIEEACSMVTEAVEAFARHAAAGDPDTRARGARRREGAARITLATVLLLLGEEETPERQARLALELALGAPELHGPALATLAEILLAEGRADEALAAARQAVALVRRDGTLDSAEARARLVELEALAATGQQSSARAALAEAKHRIVLRAAAIGDPALRQSFLEQVPENARTLDLTRLAGIVARAPASAPHRPPPSVGPESEAAAGLREAERALARGNPEAAIARVEQAMNHVAPSDVRAELRAVMARAYGFRNAWAPAGRWAEQGMREATPGSRGFYAAFAARMLAAAQLGERAPILAGADAVPRMSASTAAAAAVPVALAALSIALLPLGESERSQDCEARMERAGAPLAARDPLVRGWMIRARAERARTVELDPWTALRLDEAAREAFTDAGDGGEAALSQAGAGVSRWQLGAFERAEETLRAAREAGSQRGYVVALTTVYLAWTLADAGRLAEAGAEILAGLRSERSRQNPSLRAAASAVLAEVLLRRGELDAAEREAEVALAVEGVIPLHRTATLATVAAVRLARGRPAEALDLARKARAEREALRVFGFRDTFVRLVHLEALLASGDVAAARTPMSRAYARLLVHSSRIGDPALRRSFLERVPENARTLALAQRWLGDVGDHAFR
jgi:tetratricopeptide (TPR) repeat protein